MTRTPRFTDTQASVLLDLVRGLAAVFVLLEHWRNILFVDFRDVAAHRVLWAPAYVVSSCGVAAVMLFFVLSGYLVGGSAMRMFRQGTWSWREYLLHRFVRLWIVLLPALLLCALFDTVGLHLPFAQALYHGLSDDHVILDVTAHRSVSIFLGNLFFVQTIRVPTFGSAGSLWSLANEFWYYLLFPAVLLVFRRSTGLLARVGYALLIVAIFKFVGWGIGLSAAVWAMGALLAWLPAPRWPARLGAVIRWSAAVLYLLPFLTFKRWTVGVNLSNFSLGVLTTLLLWTMLSANSAATGHAWERFARWLSSFSFTLYLVHIPLCTLLAAWFVRQGRFQPGLRSLPIAMGILLILITVAALLARVTEYRTNEARLWIQRRIFRTA
ncbi:acyltransferase family protein [Terriglobus aquaticus]|uniref:Acyltransferase family protein n=1 Tax=Terriglobus aquaticus TaxID=940139 RepID=A0ABW9KGK6_9BACT|nr:acyltransferase family protein [Terriglobus aquaticus]